MFNDFYRNQPIDDALDDYRAQHDDNQRNLPQAGKLLDYRHDAQICLDAGQRAYSQSAKRRMVQLAQRYLIRAVLIEHVVK